MHRCDELRPRWCASRAAVRGAVDHDHLHRGKHGHERVNADLDRIGAPDNREHRHLQGPDLGHRDRLIAVAPLNERKRDRIVPTDDGARLLFDDFVGTGGDDGHARQRGVLGGRDGDKSKIVAAADIVLCAAAAGVQVLSAKHLAKSRRTVVVADVNAVPPAGIEGVELFDLGRPLGRSGILSVGPLAIGDIKYKTQAALFRRMIDSEKSLMLDFTDAFAMARQLVGKKSRK